MFEGNAMERINNCILDKNSRICAVLSIDDVPDFFKNRFSFQENEGIYEYAIAYLQVIAGNIPVVKIISKEKNELFWSIVEFAKDLGLFVICEIKQEDIGYILESETRRIIENPDAVIIDVELELNKLDVVEQFIGLLKKEGKAVFINPRKVQEDKKKEKWWRRIFKEKEITAKELFSKLCNKAGRICYDENCKPTYLMIGLVITRPDQKEMLNPYVFAICNYEEKIDDIVNVADGDGLGLLITIDSIDLKINSSEHSYTEQTWAERIKLELTRKNEIINNAINKFYGIED